MQPTQNSKDLDFVAIGDTVVDAFIRLNMAEEVVDATTHKDMLCLSFADKVPYEFVEIISGVGNSANAAVSAARLSLSSGLISNLGDDTQAEDCLKNFTDNNVSTAFIKKNSGMKTNYHYVLWFHNERTILIKHELYPYEMPNDAELCSPKYLYLSSLGESSLPFHHLLHEYLLAHPETKLVFQPGTFQMKFGTKELAGIYQSTEIFFCNLEEAQRILGNTEADIKTQLSNMHALGPKTVVITDGPKGAYASNRSEILFMAPYPDPKPAYERTGAGDAFASTFTTAVALGKTLEVALQWASINSMSVVQFAGAQKGLLHNKDLEEYLAKAPGDWTAKKL